jgi:hypothetical protein
LARNGRDWHTLLEFCGLVGTVIIDEDGVYDPASPNDRLLLGMKGTMSEMELSVFRQRSIEAMKQKAGRGELFLTVAVGYVKGGRDNIEKDPDRRVQEAVALVFRKFIELRTIRQVLIWFRQEKIPLPVLTVGDAADRIVWRAPVYPTVHHILTNSVYAGAQSHHPIAHFRPAELATFQPLGDKHHTTAIPEDQLDPIGSLRSEHINDAREGIGANRLAHQRRQPLGSLAEVDRPGRNDHPDVPGGANHVDCFSARITAAIARGLAADPMRTATPAISSSISGVLRRRARGSAVSAGGGSDSGAASITAGTNKLALSLRRASRRHANSCCGVNPCRRATPQTVVPAS